MMHQGEDGSMGCCPVLRVDTEVRFTAGVNLPKNLGDSPVYFYRLLGILPNARNQWSDFNQQ